MGPPLVVVEATCPLLEGKEGWFSLRIRFLCRRYYSMPASKREIERERKKGLISHFLLRRA
jgi:hypothetical protein